MPIESEKTNRSAGPGKITRLDHGAPQYEGSTHSPRRVTITEPETVSPLMLGKTKSVGDDFRLDGPRQFSAGLSKRMSGRLPNASAESNVSQSPLLQALEPSIAKTANEGGDQSADESLGDILGQISAWISKEREKSRSKLHRPTMSSSFSETKSSARYRASSDASDYPTALEKLEALVAKGLALHSPIKSIRRKSSLIKPSSFRKLRRQSSFAASSDTDFEGPDVKVPSCDVVLDNARTLNLTGSISSSQTSLVEMKATAKKDREAWQSFKFEIVRLTHTLRLKGWRQVSMDRSSDISVERLSGALTNAVYVVAPPENLARAQPPSGSDERPHASRRQPVKLLLRIYGPQVEHLIDRDTELAILKRLARKRIGPRLLGTFLNGRFEEFFHARTLRPEDLRNAEISQLIAKRMRELHEGVELLPRERLAGPFIWQNWDKWVEKGGDVAHVLDDPKAMWNVGMSAGERRLVCGTPWSQFKETVGAYRKWLDEQYGGVNRVREQLVFAHNDTQYGNILRLEPPGESPLLHPANEHKQLVVIDFEYSNANLPALEFANHFTEWCYNYHDPAASYACNANRYPSFEEQYRFIRAYLRHQPYFTPTVSTPRLGPVQTPRPGSSSSSIYEEITQRFQPGPSCTSTMPSTMHSFDLDQVSSGSALHESEERAEAELDAEIRRLIYETRLWRVANSALWTVWGLVQAPVPAPGSTITEADTVTASPMPMSDPLDAEDEEAKKDMDNKRPDEADDADTEEEFDYIQYSRDRVMFFWGDMIQLGFVKEDQLPEDVKMNAKRISR